VPAGTSRSVPVSPSRVNVAPPRLAFRVTSTPFWSRIAAFVWVCTSSTTAPGVTLPSNIRTSLVDPLFAVLRIGDQLRSSVHLCPAPPIQVYGPAQVRLKVQPVLLSELVPLL